MGWTIHPVKKHCSKKTKPLLKSEVNNEIFFISFRSYYEIYYLSLLYAACILYLVEYGDTTRIINMQMFTSVK